MKRLLPALASLTLAACGVLQPARMELPPELAARGDAIPIEGMGGGTRGSFTVAGTSGSYTRSAQRLALFNETAVFDWGGTSFTLNGTPTVAAVCKMRQTTVNISIVGFSPKPMAYECDFRLDGQPAPARLSLQESRDTMGQLTAQAQRRGVVQWDRVALTIRSVHRVQGSPLPLQTPIGYLFEQDGRAIGAVELNGLTPALWLPPAAQPRERQAVLVGALAVAVFWDPAQID